MPRVDWQRRLATGETLEGWLRESYPRLTNQDLLDNLETILGFRPRVGTVATKAFRLGLSKPPEIVSEALSAARVPGSSQPRYTDPPRIAGDVVILADLQIPYHDSDFINRILGLAEAWKVRQCILAGDAVDLASFSPYGKDAEIFAEKEFAESEAVIDAIAEHFDKCLWLFGNHEDRLKRMLNKELAASRFLRLFTKRANVEITEYYYCFVEPDWIVAHPKNASVISSRVPQWLTEKYCANVAAGHGHLWGMATDRSGRRLAVDTGICADPERLAYTTVRLNTRPAMVQGAMILRGGFPWLLSPKWTDWEGLRRL